MVSEVWEAVSGVLGLGKQRNGIGWSRLMPLVKWCWHAEGLLWEVVIHHDFRMTQSSTRLLGLWSGIRDWCEVDVCVKWRSEKETVCICGLWIGKDRPVVKLFLWRGVYLISPSLFYVLLRMLMRAPLVKVALNQAVMISAAFCESYHVAKCLYLLIFEGAPIPCMSFPYFVHECLCMHLDTPLCVPYCISLSRGILSVFLPLPFSRSKSHLS